MEIKGQIRDLAARTKDASRVLANASGGQKAAALQNLAGLLLENQTEILEANAQDVQKAREAGLDQARLGRLQLTQELIQDMARACEEVSGQADPVGGIENMQKRPNGMLVGRMRIPLGVVAMIYESRPNVTVEAGILCVLAGNGLILRGGSEAFASNQALARLFSRALEQASLPGEAVQLVPTTDRQAVQELLKLEEYVDVVIPRGGEGLIRAVVQEASMPVLKHYQGVCHIYVHADAGIDQALQIIYNSKVQKPGVCNALECLLVHQDIASELLPKVGEKLGAAGVEFRADARALSYLGDKAVPAREEDFGCEFLDLVLAVKVIASQEEAQEHIENYGSNHTEAILTQNYARAMRFLNNVDASLVICNASTRFNDGGQLGLGAEIGISTSKLHAYGPMGVKELTTSKFVLLGQGQVRAG
ncbi:MAG: glutamate-5-semialdehyde dehydrogenase [Thermodesulfobacteriota bacterium]